MIFVVLFLFEIAVIEASHFRGGTVSWKHIRSFDGDIQEIEVDYRLGWRRDSGSPQCNDSYIESQDLLYSQSSWIINTGIYGSQNYPAGIKCTTFFADQNWAYGSNTFYVNVTEIYPFSIQYEGYAWIGTMIFGGGSWSILGRADKPGARSDTGIFNRPPSTFSSPVVRLQRGCVSDIVIPKNDPDNDNVFCRYAIGSECAGICGNYSHFSLNETTCTIHYDGLGGLGLVPVALMLEDYPLQTILVGNTTVTESDYISQVPLQFLVQIDTTTDCNVKPLIPEDSILEGTTFVLSGNGEFNETLYATPSADEISIILFVILGPLGLQKSDIIYIGNDVYIAYLHWRPAQEQKGTHSVCYYAVDQNGKESEQTCFQIVVAETANSCDIDNGGCSDICIPVNGGNICNCSNPCWELDFHGKTCVPRTTITCTGNEVQILVDECSTDKTIVAGTSLDYFTYSECQSVSISSGYQLYFSPDQCGTQLELSAVGVKYNIYMWTWENFGNSSVNSIIVRGEWRIVRLSCFLPSVLNLTASFLPLPSLNEEIVPETVVVDGLGTFLLYFDFYRSVNFQSTYTRSEYPLSVALNENIYFALRAEGRTGLELFVERCIAMSTPFLTPATLTYTLIENGCIVDQTINVYPSPSTMETRFSFQAFEFENNLLLSRANSAAFINCQIVMCDTAANDTRCSQGCLGGLRRKRSSENEPRLNNGADDDDELYLTPPLESPPSEITRQIQFIFPEEDTPTTSHDNTKWIMIGVVSAVLLLALYLVYRIVLVRRRRGNDAGASAAKGFFNDGSDFATKITA